MSAANKVGGGAGPSLVPLMLRAWHTLYFYHRHKYYNFSLNTFSLFLNTVTFVVSVLPCQNTTLLLYCTL